MNPETCPCASGKIYAECCEPLHLGHASPRTATQLMRARYAAYALALVDYLHDTAGPRVQKEFDAANTKTWSQSATWTGLDIVKETLGGPGDETGVVEFIAHYTVKEKPFDHHEVAKFEKRDGVWVFMDGRILGTDPLRREAPKVGRNDPCPCSSGKKFKKCCAGKTPE
ncbi:MAG: YchJ family protein [Kiritimatiellaeota bacterium]|nr:YchJ family protein [Kiritimatiellota bacterium]